MSVERFGRRTGLVAVGQAAVKLTQLIVAVLLVRLLSPDEWNQAAFLFSIYLTAVTVGTLNLQHGIVFFLPRADPRHRRGLVVQNLGVLLLIGTLIAAALTIGAATVSGGRLVDVSLLPILGVAIMLELPAACIATTMIAIERFAAAALWDLAGTVLLIGSTVAATLLGHGVRGIAIALCAIGACRAIAALVVVHRSLDGPMLGAPWSLLRRQLEYALPLGATLGVSMLNRAVDKWFIAMFDPENFGTYAVAAQEVPLLSVLPYAGGAALVSALVDAFRDGDIALARTHWLHLTMTMSTFVVPLSVLLVLLAPEMFTVVFTADFGTGVLPFQIFTIITIHRVAEYGMLLRAAGRTGALLVVAIVTCGTNAVLAGFGAALGGMVGASVGTLVASAIGWACALRFIAGSLAVRVRDAFAWRAWLGSVAIAVAAALVTVAVLGPIPLGTAGSVVAKVLVFVAGYVFGAVKWHHCRHSAAPSAVVVPEPAALLAPTSHPTGRTPQCSSSAAVNS